MAIKETVVIDAQVNTGGADESVQSLKSQLKDANLELQNMIDKFGETSDQAIEAAKKVAGIKDAIGDANDLVGAFNADEKFAAFSGALNGVAAGLTAAQQTMGLFGAESEVVNAGLEKVQGLMDLSDSLSTVTSSVDAFKNFGATLKEIPIIGKAAAAAQRLWNAAMSANPIGTITIAITALIAGITALVYWFKSSADAAEKQKKQVENSSKALDDMKKSNEKANTELERSHNQQLAMAKATGKSADEIRKLELKLADEKIATARATEETAKNTLEREKNALAALKQQDAGDEVIKGQEENIKKAEEYHNTSVKQLETAETAKVDLINKQQVEVAQAQTDAYNKRLEDQKSAAEKSRQQAEDAAKKVKEDTKKLNEDLFKLQQENELFKETNENKKALIKSKADFEIAKKEINNTKATQQAKNALIIELEKKHQYEIAEINKKIAEEELTKQNETFDLMNQARWAKMKDQILVSREMEEDKYQKEIDALIKSLNNKEITQEDYDKRREASKQLHEQRVADIDKRAAEERQKKLDAQNKVESDTFDIINQARLAKLKNAGTRRLEEEALRYQKEIDGLVASLNNKEITEVDFNARREAIKSLHEGKLTEIEKQNSDERQKKAQEEHEKKVAQIKAVGDAMTALTDVVGKETAVGKALGIAQATINTYLGATEVLRAKSVLPEPAGTIVKLANVAAIIASGIKSVKAIVGTQVPGGGGGGKVPSESSVAPIVPQMSSTAMNQAMINQMGNASTRAFVLESDVSGNQERIRRLNRAARIN